jgi:AcrR family transcriptional regulator
MTVTEPESLRSTGTDGARMPTAARRGGCPDDGTGLPEPKDHRKAPRRRGEALNAAIFEATIDELRAVGYAQLTMEGVANRACASKGSIYRRWSSRAELVVDAVHHANPVPRLMSDTGNVRDDVLSFLDSFARVLNGPSGEAVRGLLAESVRDRELLEIIKGRFIEPAHVQLMEALRRGVVRGEVRPGALTPLVASVAPALLRQYAAFTHHAIPRSALEEIVDEVVMPLVRA